MQHECSGSISLSKVDVELDHRPILRNLSLTLSEKRIGIIGLNGSGKSTFARLLNGLQLPSKGSVTIDGLNTSHNGKAVRERVGFLFQNPETQIVYPTVWEDIGFGLRARKEEQNAVRKQITDLLQSYDALDLEERAIHQLSGGEKQLVALLGVLIMEPHYLVLDEPTTFLDAKSRSRLIDIINQLTHRCIVVTHDLDLIRGFDRVLLLHKGSIIADGAPEAVFTRYEALCE